MGRANRYKTQVTLVVIWALLFLGAACQKPVAKLVSQTNTASGQSQTNRVVLNPNEPDLVIQHLGVNLGAYDPTTGMAGDFRFTKNKLQQNRIWMDFGYVIPGGNSATGQDKANPQPTFILPLGTKVHSLVDGIVVDIPELYSHDYSVMVASSADSRWIYETEHVLNPVVKKGDRVTAGQVVAEVSTWSRDGNDGLGMFEIGILHGGNPPEHVCPFAYLDPLLKAELQTKISAMYAAWESYKGDSTLYDEAAMPIVGCQRLDAIEG